MPAGEMKYMSTGASPISTEVFEFMRICFGATVSEGYGMTETACTIAMTRPDDPTMGHVGAPLDCCEIKLEDIPDMNYKNTDQPYPRGEVSCLFVVSLPHYSPVSTSCFRAAQISDNPDMNYRNP